MEIDYPRIWVNPVSIFLAQARLTVLIRIVMLLGLLVAVAVVHRLGIVVLFVVYVGLIGIAHEKL